MWHRAWGPASCFALLLFACGKSERGEPNETAGAGSSVSPSATAGKATGGAPSSAGANGLGASSGKAAGGASGGKAAGGTGGDEAAGGALVEPGEAGAPTSGGDAGCGYYHACGCGCCAAQPSQAKCVYPDLGQDLNSIIAADLERSRDTVGCANAGCSVGQAYYCCQPPAPDDDDARYETSLYIGGYDRLRLHKQSAGGCSTLALVAPSLADSEFPVELPEHWTLDQITRASCASSALGQRALGAIGTLRLRVNGDACVVDAHVTAFFETAVQGIDAERFDVEGIPIDIAVGQCR